MLAMITVIAVWYGLPGRDRSAVSGALCREGSSCLDLWQVVVKLKFEDCTMTDDICLYLVFCINRQKFCTMEKQISDIQWYRICYKSICRCIVQHPESGLHFG